MRVLVLFDRFLVRGLRLFESGGRRGETGDFTVPPNPSSGVSMSPPFVMREEGG